MKTRRCAGWLVGLLLLALLAAAGCLAPGATGAGGAAPADDAVPAADDAAPADDVGPVVNDAEPERLISHWCAVQIAEQLTEYGDGLRRIPAMPICQGCLIANAKRESHRAGLLQTFRGRELTKSITSLEQEVMSRAENQVNSTALGRRTCRFKEGCGAFERLGRRLSVQERLGTTNLEFA